ncbi:MAG: hypothetical protein ABW133_05415 [Polyangiaceae bacterium]
MSAQRPPDPADRPRMAEALASLKEGLRDTADPLYDGWKLRPKPAPIDAPPEASTAAAGPLPPIAPPPFVPRFKPLLAAQPGITIDLSRDRTPEGTPIGDVEVTIEDDFGDPETTRDFDTVEEDAFFAQGQTTEMASAPPVVHHSSVQADTVRVRVIRYPSFPRWALIVAAALVLFALCILALRPTWIGEGDEALATGDVTDEPEAPRVAAKATEIAAAAPVVVPAPTSKFAPPVFEAAPAIEAEKEDLASAALIEEKIAEKEERLAPGVAPLRPAMGRPTVAPIGSAVQGRIPAATRRRSGSRDFFRDPGF